MNVQFQSHNNTAKWNDVLDRVRSMNENLPGTASLIEIAQKIIQDNYPKEHQWNDCKTIKFVAKQNGDVTVTNEIKAMILKVAPNYLSTLLKEMLNIVFMHLDPISLVNLSKTNRELHDQISTERKVGQALSWNNRRWIRLYCKLEGDEEERLKILELFFKIAPLDQHELLPFLGQELEKFLSQNHSLQKLSLWKNIKICPEFCEWHDIHKVLQNSKNKFQIQNLELHVKRFIPPYALSLYDAYIFKFIRDFLNFNDIYGLTVDDFCSFYQIISDRKFLRNTDKNYLEYNYNFKTFEVSFQDGKIYDKIPDFIKDLPVVSHLRLFTLPFNWKESFQFLSKVFPNLEEITLQHIDNDDKLIADFFSYFLRLKILRFNTSLSKLQFQNCCELVLQRDENFRIDFLVENETELCLEGKKNKENLQEVEIQEILQSYPDLCLKKEGAYYTVRYRELHTRLSYISFFQTSFINAL